MQKIIIGTKNQIVIPKEIRENMQGVKPGRSVSIYQMDTNTIVIKTSKKDWIENSSGAMKKIWQNIDPQKELKKMRAQWDE